MNLFKLVGSIFVDNEEANKSISKTDSQADKLAKNFVKSAETAAKWGLGIAAAAVGMATAVGTAMVKITDDTREYRTEMGKLNTAFETSGFKASETKRTYQELQSILGETDQAVEASNHLAKLCKNEEDLAIWTNICTGVYAEFGASLPIEGLTEAANETAKIGTLTGGLADALNWAGINEEDFQKKLDKCSSEQERQALITKTMNELYAESAERYKVNNKEIIEANKAQERQNAVMAKLGAAIEPVVTKARNLGVAFVDKMIPGIVGFGEKVIEYIPKTVEWFQKYRGIVVGVVASIGVLTGAIGLYNTVQAVKTAMNTAEAASLGALFKMKLADAAATAAAMAPYVAIVAAIAAVVAAGVWLYQNWEDVKKWASELWDSLSEKFDNIKKDITEKFAEACDFIDKIAENIYKSVTKTIESMRKNVANKFESMKKDANDKFESMKASVTDKAESIKNNAINKIESMRQNAVNKLESMKNSASEKFEAIKTSAANKIESMRSNVLNKIEYMRISTAEKFELIKANMINSMQNARENVEQRLVSMKNAYESNGGGIQGIVAATMAGVQGIYSSYFNTINNLTGGKLGEMVGFFQSKLSSAYAIASSVFESIRSSIDGKISSARETVRSAIDNIKGFFNFEWSLPKIKLPHFNITGSFSLGPPPTIPKFSVSWYQKAMDNPVILNKPALFGFSPASGKFLGGGEAGDEVLAGKNTLMSMIYEAVQLAQNNNNERMVELLEDLVSWLVNGGLSEVMIDVLTKHVKLRWENREIARLVRTYA